MILNESHNPHLGFLSQNNEIEIELQKKQCEIEELSKKIRQLEFQNKQEQKSRNDLLLQKHFLEDQLSLSKNTPMLEIAKEFESKLTSKEKETFALRENELKLKQEIHRLKTCNYEAMNENKKNLNSIKKVATPRRLAAQSFYKKEEVCESATFNRKSTLCRSNTIIDNNFRKMKSNSQIKIDTKEESINHYMFFEEYVNQLKSQIKNLELEIDQIKESAIQTVVEKELTIEELTQSLQEKEVFYGGQNDLLQKTVDFLADKLKCFENNNNNNSTSSCETIEYLQNELERYTTLYQNCFQKQETYFDLSERLKAQLETQQNEHDFLYSQLRDELNYQVYQKTLENSEQSRKIEEEMVERIGLMDEKLQMAERQIQSLKNDILMKEKAFFNEKIEVMKEAEENGRKLRERERNKMEEKNKKLEDEITYLTTKRVEEIKDFSEKMVALENSKSNLNRKLAGLGCEMNIVVKKNEDLQEKIKDLNKKNETLEMTLEIQLKKFQSEMDELKQKNSYAVSYLEAELKKSKNSENTAPIQKKTSIPIIVTINSKSIKERQEEEGNESEEICSKEEGKKVEENEEERSEKEEIEIVDEEEKKGRSEMEKEEDEIERMDLLAEFEKENFELTMENSNLKSQMDNLMDEIETLKGGNNNESELKMIMNQIKADYEEEIDKNKKEMAIYREENQKMRGELFGLKNDLKILNDTRLELEKIKKEKEFYIMEILRVREEMAENYNFFNEELEKARKNSIEWKIMYSQAILEKEHYLIKLGETFHVYKKEKKEKKT